MLKTVFVAAALSLVVTGVSRAQPGGREGRYPAEKIKMNYGSNVLRVAPISAMDLGVGFGISYERILGPEQKVGVILPLYLVLEDKQIFDPTGTRNGAQYNSYFFFNPGVKIYPFGQRKVTYAVGPSLMFAHGGGKEWQTDYEPVINTPIYKEVDIRKTRIGMLVNNYVNFQITRDFNLGLEAGLGMLYYDRERREFSGYTNYYNNGFNVTGQFSMTFGFRF